MSRVPQLSEVGDTRKGRKGSSRETSTTGGPSPRGERGRQGPCRQHCEGALRALGPQRGDRLRCGLKAEQRREPAADPRALWVPAFQRLRWRRPAHLARRASAPPTQASLPRPPRLGPPPPRRPGRLRWGRPALPTACPASRPPRPPCPPQVGSRGPPRPFGRVWPSESPQFLAGGRGVALQVFDVLAAGSLDLHFPADGCGGSRQRGPLSRARRSTAARVGRPRGPAASSRVRPPGGCSHVAGGRRR